MKIYRLVLLLFTSALLTNCSITGGPEELPEEEFTNKLLVNGVLDEIKFAEMKAFSKLPANANYNYELTFYTGTTTATYSPAPSYSGVGSYFKFSLWTQDSTIASGSYIIDGFVNKDFSISQATTELNVDWSTGQSDFGSYLNGSVQIENRGAGEFVIDINCTDYEGNPVTAFYEGGFYNY